MQLDPRLHFVVATAIIVKNGKFLIAKRAEHEKAFPKKWTVPGGKLVTHEYRSLARSVSDYDGWYNLTEWLLRKEVREEVGLEIEKPRYVTDVVFFRPDGYPVVTLSYTAFWKSGEVKLCKDLTDYAWVSLEEAKGYDLIEGIWQELQMVERMIRGQALGRWGNGVRSVM